MTHPNDGSLSSPRTITDAEGMRWTVQEYTAPIGTRAGERSLVFISPYNIRRVWNYPANWHELTAEELLELSWTV